MHIELNALKALGKWLDNSGWVAVINQSGHASAGTADSFLKISHITKTRHDHRVTVAALHILMNKAYEMYCNSVSVHMSLFIWSKQLEEEFQLSVLTFVRSIRE